MRTRLSSVLLAVELLLTSVLVLGLFQGPAAAMTYPAAAYHFDGSVANELSGTSSALLDLNGDGIADLAVGAPYNGTAQQGSVTFYLSSGGIPFKTAITTFGWPGSLFGFALASVGNVSGKGPTLAVGAPHASPAGATQAGNITLFFSNATAPGKPFNGKPGAWINSTHAGESLGYSLAAAGDLNADGFDDILTGAPFCDTGAAAGGCAYAFYGAAPRPHRTPDLSFDSTVAGANFGWSIAGGASVDGNSALDLVVGAPNYPPLDAGNRGAGAAYVIRNPTGTIRTSIVAGANAGDQFGSAVAMGDFNGDTISDIAIGAPYNDDGFTQAGEVSIIYGSSPFKATIGLLLHGLVAGEWFGSSVAAGDFHQDNLADLLVGAPGSTLNKTGVGRAYAFYGSPVPWTAANLTLTPGDSGAGAFGASLAVGGDFDGDKGPDYSVGDPLFQAGTLLNAGRVSLYRGDVLPTQNRPEVRGWVCVPFTWNGTTNSCSGLGGFDVTLESVTLHLSTTSAANGSFSFTALPGTYWLNTSMFPYIDNSTSFGLVYNQVKTVVIFPDKVPVVTGVARDAVNRTGYAGVTVALYNATNVLVNATTTLAAGAYSMFVPPAFLPGAGQSSAMVVRMWDAAHYTNSTAAVIRRNVTTTANLFLNRFPSVSGTVFDRRTLAPISGATIQATQGATIVATALSNNRGAYAFVAVNASVPHPLYFNVTCGGTCGRYAREQTSFAVSRNTTYSQNFSLIADLAPAISNVWPILPTYESTAVFSVSANATDNNGVQQVQLWYRFNNTGSPVQYAVDTSAPYTFSFNSTSARGDGRYGFYTIALDYAGNIEASPTTNDTWTWVDTHLPTLSLTRPVADQKVLTSWVNVTWTARDSGSGLAGVDVRLDAGAWIHAGLASYENLTSVPDGNHTVVVNATDRAGNSRSASVAFSVNTAAPVVSFAAPSNNSFVATASVGVSWTIATPGAALSLLEVRVDTGTWQSIGTSSTSHTFTGLSNGAHDLWVRATTPNAQTTVSLHVTVDLSPPSVSFTSPTGTPWFDSRSVPLAFTVTDATSGVASASLSLDNATGVDVTGDTTYTVTGLADGTHQAVLTAADRAGNEQTALVRFRVDATPPVVTINAPTNGSAYATSTVSVQWQSSDSGSGILLVDISVDGGAFEPLASAGKQDFTGLAAGTHRLTIRATDVAGNVGESTVSFTVATQNLGGDTLTLGLIAAAVVIVVIVALLVVRMRKPKEPAPPKEEPPKPEETKKP